MLEICQQEEVQTLALSSDLDADQLILRLVSIINAVSTERLQSVLYGLANLRSERPHLEWTINHCDDFLSLTPENLDLIYALKIDE